MVAPVYRVHAAIALREPFGVPCEEMRAEVGLLDVLQAIAPWKAGARAVEQLDRLILGLAAPRPFGPSSAQIVQLLLPDGLPASRRRVQEHFGVSVDLDDRAAPERATLLDLYEFVQLDAIARTGSFPRGVLVSVFLDEMQVYAFHVPIERTLGEVLATEEPLRLQLDAQVEDDLFHPVTHASLSRDELCSHRTDLVCFRSAGYALLPRDSMLRPFPYFNRPLEMQPAGGARGLVTPCCNCLACVAYCPSRIHPALILHNLQAGQDEEAVALGLPRCVQCGLCSYVCPSNLPLYQELSKAVAPCGQTKGGCGDPDLPE
jgi:ferredoxin